MPSYEEFVDYCLNKNADIILVRAKLDDKWQSVALSTLPKDEAMKFIDQWWIEKECL